MYKLVLIRHGESLWNKENRFTGWKDVDLSEKGEVEAVEAGQRLQAEGYVFDEVYTSLLKRAIQTAWSVLKETELCWIPVHKHWQLNERHYGALEGLNKAETAAKHGDEQVLIWRRSYATPPPALELDDERHPKRDPRYAHLSDDELPATECLADTVDRVIPFYQQEIAPKIKAGQRLLIAAHGNSLRAMVKYLDQLSDEEIMQVNIPTGKPLVYELDENLTPTNRYYLADQDEIEAAMNAVANQGKAEK